jgi:HEAT repeat protein
MRHTNASRVAASALNDPLPIIRVTAAQAVIWLPASEAAGVLLPLLSDKDEFVRREAAYALGKTKSQQAVNPLIDLLSSDKEDSVRAAAVVALGAIADERAVVPLSQVLYPSGKKKGKSKENVFVLRAAAHSLGQIGSRAGVPALVASIGDEKLDPDVKREAVSALGAIRDPAASEALRGLLNAADPYLARAAHEALRRIEKGTN